MSVTTTWSAVDGPSFSTVRVNSVPAGSPATTGSAPVVALVSTSSASSITVVSAESLLLTPAFGGSGVVSESTRAVLRRVVGPAEGSTSTTISIRSPSPSSPAARTVARVHSTVPLPGEVSSQVQPLPAPTEDDAYEVPGGRASVTTIGPAASEGPLLPTWRV